MKEANLNPSTHLTLETLAEAAVSLQLPESSQDAANLLKWSLLNKKISKQNLKE